MSRTPYDTFSKDLALAALVQPGDMGDLGPVAGQVHRALRELEVVDRAVGQVALQRRELVLVLDQAGTQLLLGHLGVALDGLLLALDHQHALHPHSLPCANADCRMGSA